MRRHLVIILLVSSACAGDLNGRAKQCSSESATRGKRKRQSKRPSTKRGIMQIPPIKITNKGETYFINIATDSTYAEKKTTTWKYHEPMTGTTNQHTTKKAGRWQLPAKTQSNPVRKREENRNTRKKTMAAGYQTA